MAPSQDPHEILGVSKDAPWGKIEKAYRRLAMKWHPDRNPQDPSAQDRFKEIRWAYEKLKEEKSARREAEERTPSADYDHPFWKFFAAMKEYAAKRKGKD
jgi:curved DNA-binding protein CbpA